MGTKRFLRMAIAACAGAALDGVAQTYSIDAHVLTSGSSVRAGNPCFRLVATIGAPVGGFSWSTDYTLSAGVRERAPVMNDTIFFTGFEKCTP